MSLDKLLGMYQLHDTIKDRKRKRKRVSYMKDAAIIIGIVLGVLVLIVVGPVIVAANLGVLFGLAFWPSFWLAIGTALTIGGIAGASRAGQD